MRLTLNKRMKRFLVVKKTKLSNQNVNMQENSRIGAKNSIAQPINAQSSIVCICAHLRWLNIELNHLPAFGNVLHYYLLVEFVSCYVNKWYRMIICLNKYFISRSYYNTLRMCKELITIDGATMEGVSMIFFCELWI